MSTGRTEICKETCFVIDHCTQFLEDSGARLELDSTSKSRSAPSFLSTLQKTTWTCIVEGVVEYCRIIYDIFTPEYKIQILCSDENAFHVNEFEEQNIQQILKGFGDLGPPKKSYESTTSVYHGVGQGAEDLLRPTMQNCKTTKRMIVITAIEDESDARSISNVVWEMQNTKDKTGSVHIDLLVVNISTKGEDITSPKRQVSPHLDVSTVTFHSKTCSVQIPMLTRKHYYLKSTIITGIPMKEEQHAGTSANYDVEIIHSAAAHHDTEWLYALDNLSDHEPLSKSSVTLKWCTPKANSLQDIQPCVGIYRVTPSEVNSRPAACLIMFLLQGRTVMLEQPKKSGSKVLTHMLNSHGGDIYIHVLISGRSHFEDPPSIAEGIGGRVTDYRVTDFGRFMEENRLAPYEIEDEESSVSPNKKAMDRLERYSRYWPLVICDTLIFNMYTNLEPMLSLLLKPELSEDEVQECKKVIYKLQAMESRNDTLPLPIVTLKGKGSKREEQYKQVWKELEMFIEGASKTSPMHKKVLNCLRGDQETSLPTEDVPVNMQIKGVGVIVDKLRTTDSERDRKTVKEVPSDPRRRRRTSETSTVATPKEQATTPSKKSPRVDEPPTKVRRSGSRNAINTISPTLQMKSSLLSIWENHMNLNASRFHEEFLGRKKGTNGKYQLYQPDVDPTGQNDQKSLSGKGGKDW